MGNHAHFLSTLLVISSLSVLLIADGAILTSSMGDDFTPSYALSFLNRTSFPSNFLWGAASAAFQVEGGAKLGGKGPSIWDTFTHQHPEKIRDHSNGDVACDSFHKYKEDVKMLKYVNLNSYRFSIAWPRVLPLGKLSGGVNEEGISYYNNLIDDVLANGLEPFVTLFHWDMPQALEDEYGGFRSEKVVSDYRDFTDLCFKRFGDRVKHWITFNEPWSFATTGYVDGAFAPGRCSAWMNNNCSGGDSGREPYMVTHNQLLGHAAAVALYREKYQKSQKGEIRITLVTIWAEPFTNSKQDKNAQQRTLDFRFGWFMDPITKGDYPRSMRSLVGDRLPKFSPKQSKMLAGSFDFLGLNYYTSAYAQSAHLFTNSLNKSYDSDPQVNLQREKNGVLIGPQQGSSWLYVYPKGLRDLLLYITKKYNSPRIYITENGVDQIDTSTAPLTIKEAQNDTFRIKYYHDHLSYMLEAMKAGAKVEGFFAWALMDNFEWVQGYVSRFGIYYVDYKDDQKRYPKNSAHWLRNFLKTSL